MIAALFYLPIRFPIQNHRPLTSDSINGSFFFSTPFPFFSSWTLVRKSALRSIPKHFSTKLQTNASKHIKYLKNPQKAQKYPAPTKQNAHSAIPAMLYWPLLKRTAKQIMSTISTASRALLSIQLKRASFVSVLFRAIPVFLRKSQRAERLGKREIDEYRGMGYNEAKEVEENTYHRLRHSVFADDSRIYSQHTAAVQPQLIIKKRKHDATIFTCRAKSS